MTIAISLSLAFLFVFLAGFNIWNQLAGRCASPRAGWLWVQVHRVAGYAFIALFAIFCYFMLARLKGFTDELPPRLVLHMALALSLAPLLLIKVIVARYQKASRGLLAGLGATIFALAFTLVAMNVATYLLRVASPEKFRATTSGAYVFAVLSLVAIGLLRRPKSASPGKVLKTDSPQASAVALVKSDAPLELKLVRIESQTRDAKTLRFLLPAGRQFSARPGQFLTFEWIIDGNAVRRSYSVCSSPMQRAYIEITPKRVENGFVSHFLNDRAAVGMTVSARGPYGRFFFDESRHRRIVLIAGGSGVTPMMAMLRYIDDLSLAVDSTLIYCVRAERDLFFAAELDLLQERLHGFHYVPVISDPGNERTGWKGRLCHEILEREVGAPLESTFFLCGPPPFMDHARTLLEAMGVAPSQILQESFGAPVASEAPSTPAGGVYEVRFARSARAFGVSPNETLLESAEKNGLLIPSGCREGICGTCLTRLLRGNVHMERPEALDEQSRSQGYILPCVSRAQSDLTLDA